MLLRECIVTLMALSHLRTVSRRRQLQDPKVELFMCDATGIAGLQAAVDAPGRVAGVQLLDVSLRMLHTKKQAAWQRPLVTAFQRLLRETQLGKWFFATIAKPDVRPHSSAN